MVKGDTNGYLNFVAAGVTHGHSLSGGVAQVTEFTETFFHSKERRMRASRALLGGALAFMVACGEAAVPQPVVPAAPPSPPLSAVPDKPGPAADPWALPNGPRDELAKPAPAPLKLSAWEGAVKAKGVAAPPAECTAYAKRVAASPAPADLTAALSLSEGKQIDAALVALEPKLDAKELGLVRALRGDLAPPSCADLIVDPYLAAHRTMVSRASHVLVGLSLAAKLERTGAGKPAMGDITEKEKVKAFITGPLKTWIVEQATAIETLSSGAAGLTGYGRGIAAVAAGNAEMRLVEIIRTAPTPPKWDPELKAVYQAALDEALEPRKKRGRDAALVGIADLAQSGGLTGKRTIDAFTLLTALYGGRRISELTELMVPKPEIPPPVTALQRSLAVVSPYWVDVLELPLADDTDRSESLSNGVSLGMRASFAPSAPPPAPGPALRASYARARLGMGMLGWRRVDFVEAALAAKQGTAPEDRLVLAVALALAQGPNGAADMMRAPSAAALGLRHTEALDALVAERGPLAGWAAFDAAHLRSVSPPEGPEAGPFFKDVAVRFRKAESLLTDPAKKKQAGKRAEESDAIAASTAGKP